MPPDDVKDSQEFKDALEAAKKELKKEQDEAEAGLKANKDAILKEKKALEKALAKYDGVDPEKFAEMLAAEEERATKKAKAEGDFESMKKQMEENHTKERAKLEERVGVLNRALEDQLCRRAAVEAMARHTTEAELLLPHVMGHVKMVEKDGEFRAVVIKDGTEAFMPDPDNSSSLVPMTIDHLVTTDIKKKYPSAFPSSGGTGSDAQGGEKTGAGGAPKVIQGNDPDFNKLFLEHADAIAKGEVVVETLNQ